jgi:MFS-type transporter involved in bile tolerance (Atg22 family)
MAVISLTSRLAPASSRAVAALLVCRLLPATVLAPVMGGLADGMDKRRGLTACSVVAGVASALMCAVQVPSALPALYVLLALQAAAVAQARQTRKHTQAQAIAPQHTHTHTRFAS